MRCDGGHTTPESRVSSLGAGNGGISVPLKNFASTLSGRPYGARRPGSPEGRVHAFSRAGRERWLRSPGITPPARSGPSCVCPARQPRVTEGPGSGARVSRTRSIGEGLRQRGIEGPGKPGLVRPPGFAQSKPKTPRAGRRVRPAPRGKASMCFSLHTWTVGTGSPRRPAPPSKAANGRDGRCPGRQCAAGTIKRAGCS
jgi:hypothetical protein